MIGGRRKAATLFVPILVSDVSGSDFMADDRIASMILDLDTFHCVRRLQGRLEQRRDTNLILSNQSEPALCRGI